MSLRRGEGVRAKSSDEVTAVPSNLLAGLMTGFGTNPTRIREEAHAARFGELGFEPLSLWASAGALPNDAMRVRIEAVVPPTMVAGSEVRVAYNAVNAGNAWLVPSKPQPVGLSYRWFDEKGKQVGRDATSARTPLPRTLGPADSISATLRVIAPRRCGRFTLSITFVQEFVAWFSDVSAQNQYSADVDVIE
jgi:hypothetical protein